jgi:NhaP-type Na+/H+ or K+/H+ antiporter
LQISIVALAATCFASAQAAGGSGFIACFVGGLLVSGLQVRHKEELLRGAEGMGDTLALLTLVVFGGIVAARMIDRVTWPAVLYAVLRLTVVRMLPVFLCLIGTRTRHNNVSSRLDRAAQCHRPWRHREPAGEEDGRAFAGRDRGRCSGYQVRMKPMSPGIPPGYSRTSALSPKPSGLR